MLNNERNIQVYVYSLIIRPFLRKMKN